MLGKWSQEPEWCCSQIEFYLRNRELTYNKLRIAMNYLVGTGFRTGRIKHKSISKLRNHISEEMKRIKSDLIKGRE